MDVNYVFMDCFDFQLLRNLGGRNGALCRHLIEIQNTLLSADFKDALVKVVLG